MSSRTVTGIAVLVAGITARLCVSTLGYTQDLAYWQAIVAEYHRAGAQAMMAAYAMHQGPVFGYIGVAISSLPISFSTGIAAACTAIDLGVAVALWRAFGLLPAALFFLSPISIVVSGYQRIPEGLAVGLGLCAVLLLEE